MPLFVQAALTVFAALVVCASLFALGMLHERRTWQRRAIDWTNANRNRELSERDKLLGLVRENTRVTWRKKP